jgi:hypothetical protein
MKQRMMCVNMICMMSTVCVKIFTDAMTSFHVCLRAQQLQKIIKTKKKTNRGSARTNREELSKKIIAPSSRDFV